MESGLETLRIPRSSRSRRRHRLVRCPRGRSPGGGRHVAKTPSPDRGMDPDALAVERLLRQLRQGSGGAVPPPRPQQHRRAPSVAARGQPRRARLHLPSVGGVWVRVALGAVLGAALTQWPYPGTCGAWLGLKIGAIAMLAIAGTWAATTSWRRRMAAAHIAALLIMAWGLALLTHEVLPRAGSWSDPAPWLCPPERALHAPIREQ